MELVSLHYTLTRSRRHTSYSFLLTLDFLFICFYFHFFRLLFCSIFMFCFVKRKIKIKILKREYPYSIWHRKYLVFLSFFVFICPILPLFKGKILRMGETEVTRQTSRSSYKINDINLSIVLLANSWHIYSCMILISNSIIKYMWHV